MVFHESKVTNHVLKSWPFLDFDSSQENIPIISVEIYFLFSYSNSFHLHFASSG